MDVAIPAQLKMALAVLAVGGLAVGFACLSRKPHPRSAAAAAPLPASSVDGVRLEEVADQIGLRFRWPQRRRPMRNIDAFGAGCAFLDYDNDGWPDILLVGEPTCALFHNIQGKRFEDVTHEIGLDRFRGSWTGVGAGDFDGDGWLDCVLTGYHQLALLRNKQGHALADATSAAKLDPKNWGNWGSSTGFMDLDGDGDLDLVTLNYVISGPGVQEYCQIRPGVQTGCPPSTYEPEYGRLFRNNGNGTFTDVSKTAGFFTTSGKALVVAFCDADGDGKTDFYIGNDGTPAEFLRNLGGLRFRNVSKENGTAFGETPGHSLAAMGADWGDYNRDGKMDLAVSAFSDEVYALFRNEGQGVFAYASADVGIAGATLKPLGFGAKFIDLDNDGWLDLVYANGHVYDRVNELDPASTFRQPLLVFHNLSGRKFQDIAAQLGPAVSQPLLARGLATGDFDNDGRVDFLVVDFEGTPKLYHNISDAPAHWVTLDLRGSGGNRFAYGAQVRLRAGSDVWVGQVSPASSYLSSSDPRVHFGLGPVSSPESLSILWPSGARETLVSPPVDRLVRITEGKGSSAQQ